MLYPQDVIYTYDGSFFGMLNCFFYAFARKEMPLDIIKEQNFVSSLYTQKCIDTQQELAKRVLVSFSEKISKDAEQLVKDVYCSCLPHKELHILNFLHLAYDVGGKCLSMLQNEYVDVLLKAQKHLAREAHSLLGFVRFDDFEGKLVSQITPKNFVLPRIAPHFAGRYNAESFLIYDKTHKTAFIYENGKGEYVELDDFEAPELSDSELEIRRLWRMFFETVSIEGRKNARCQMNHMPKRFWEDLCEIS